MTGARGRFLQWVALAVVLTGCAPAIPPAHASGPAERIISLAPALTEDLFAIGAGPQVVGVDSFSYRPAAAAKLPKVGHMDAIDLEKVVTLDPNLVVAIPHQGTFIAALRRAGLNVVTVKVESLDDELRAIEQLGTLSGHTAASRALVARMRATFARVAHASAKARRLRGFVVIGADPIYTAGGPSYINGLLQLVNVENVAGGLHIAWPNFSAERLEAAQPDVLIMQRSMVLPQSAPWNHLTAVARGRIVRLDDDDFLRPGPRVVDALQSLATQLEAFR